MTALVESEDVQALRDLVEIIDKAGLLNLSNGVQLGPTAWFVKASDRLDRARAVLAQSKTVAPDANALMAKFQPWFDGTAADNDAAFQNMTGAIAALVLTERRRLEAVIERDRTAVARAVTEIRKSLLAREWLRLGRGSYEWNDVRWQDEFGHAWQEMWDQNESLKKIAADKSDSPVGVDEIAAARKGEI